MKYVCSRVEKHVFALLFSPVSSVDMENMVYVLQSLDVTFHNKSQASDWGQGSGHTEHGTLLHVYTVKKMK